MKLFHKILQLVSNDSQRSLSTDFWVFILATGLLRIVEKHGLVAGVEQGSEGASVGALIVRIIRVLQHNSHTVVEAVRPGRAASEGFRMEGVGSALHVSLASCLNHSCNPNTIKYWEGNQLVVVASQPIRKGEEVTDNYGMHFTSAARTQRKSWLQTHYSFTCSCAACQLDLPRVENLPDQVATAVCPRCRASMARFGDQWKCEQCSGTRKHAQLSGEVAEVMARVVAVSRKEAESGDYGSSLAELVKCLTGLHNLVKQPFRGLVVPEQLFWRALRMIRGNHRISS